MTTSMAFCLLGPLTVRADDVIVPIATGKQQVLLAALLLNAGRTVPADQLAELLWGPALPASAAVTLRNHVKQLRRALGVGRDRIVTRPGGYLIRVDPGELDITSMEDALAAAHQGAQAGLWSDAARHAAAALALWRGEPLCDIELGMLAWQEIPRLSELRFQARELRIEAGLRLGRHAELVADARQLTADAPLREHLYVLLMRALHECGRRAEALETYQSARNVLAKELGCRPGAELQALHREILDDRALIPARSPARREQAPAGRRGVPVPRELPAAVASFTGRDTELAALDALLDTPPAGTPLTMLITAIGGTAGVGKTALAVQWAHRITALFPDGQLYVNLRGYDPGQPLSTGDALIGFLRTLGTPGQDIPPEDRERSARYRSLLAGRRMLVVLDNARDADQVRPLLPGTPGCAAVVTSRDALAGLVARDGARRLDLDILPQSDAVGLLRALIGNRVEAEPEAAAALATYCCRLPLALRVAAELAATRPGTQLAGLATELADQKQRLDLLDAGGDVRTAVRAVFTWSYRHLNPASALAFRRIGEHPGMSYDSHAVAALADISAPQAGQVLDLLHRAHLVQPAGPGRYSQHDLLRAYASELAASHDSPAERRAALTRLIEYYLHAAGTAVNVLYSAERDLRPGCQAPTVPAAPVRSDDPLAARAWLDGERANLVAIAGLAASGHWPTQAARLARTAFRYLDSGGHYAEAIAIHTYARHAASQAGDIAAEANALTNIAIAEARQCSHQEAISRLREALALFRDTGDQAGQARALGNLGVAQLRQGRYQDATTHFQDALPLFRDCGHRSGEASALNNLGLACLRMGRYQQASGHLHRSLAISRETGSLPSEARALTNLGDVEMRQGAHQCAAGHLRQSLILFRQAGDRVGEAYALASLGDLNLRRGLHEDATTCHEQALSMFRDVADRSGEAAALNGLADVLLATGQVSAARDRYATALDLAGQIGERYEQARAHYGLASTCATDGDDDQAIHHGQQALALFSDLGVPEAQQVRVLLAR